MKGAAKKTFILAIVLAITGGISYGSGSGYSGLGTILSGVLAVCSAMIGVAISGMEDSPRRGCSCGIYVKKDCGDTLYIGEEPIYISAKVVEVFRDGIEHRRQDLTRQLDIYSSDEHIEVGDTLICGAYAESSVRALEGCAGKDRGIVTVRYTGRAGTLKSNLEFKLDRKGRSPGD